MDFTMDDEKLYRLIKKAVEEVMTDNLKKIKLEMIPPVDEQEIKELEELFGKPENYKKQKFVPLDL